MNGFSKACPSGNTLIDCYQEQKMETETQCIEDRWKLISFTHNSGLKFKEIIPLYREFIKYGSVDVEVYI